MCNDPSIPGGHLLNLQPEDVPCSDAIKNTFLVVRNITGDFKLLSENGVCVFIIVSFYISNSEGFSFYCFSKHDSFTAQKPASTNNPITVAMLTEITEETPHLSNL